LASQPKGAHYLNSFGIDLRGMARLNAGMKSLLPLSLLAVGMFAAGCTTPEDEFLAAPVSTPVVNAPVAPSVPVESAPPASPAPVVVTAPQNTAPAETTPEAAPTNSAPPAVVVENPAPVETPPPAMTNESPAVAETNTTMPDTTQTTAPPVTTETNPAPVTGTPSDPTPAETKPDVDSNPPPDASLPTIVTPDNSIAGKILAYNSAGQFIVLGFPVGQMPKLEQHLFVYRSGLKVGEVKITGPQRDNNIVADLVDGEAQVNDEVRDQ
jgi:outer membrane biosynthesis protein TonB